MPAAVRVILPLMTGVALSLGTGKPLPEVGSGTWETVVEVVQVLVSVKTLLLLTVRGIVDVRVSVCRDDTCTVVVSVAPDAVTIVTLEVCRVVTRV
ncbi:hypothetical protein F5Y15DRAFT_397027 [Xylariaceae sp. FL0016]|nr:hypothetical protein F5Y15DRAFT_397027 [Xylariaceae sp. FL0016]